MLTEDGETPEIYSVTERLYLDGKLFNLVYGYLEQCKNGADEDKEGGRGKGKTKGKFPNIAGFCRFIGVGISDITEFGAAYPSEYDRLLAIFEDEALNSELSASLLSAYMKKRMLYSSEDLSRTYSGEVNYCFEHDVYADGE